MRHIVVGLGSAATDAAATDPGDRMKDTVSGTDIEVAGMSTGSQTSKVLHLVVQPYRRVTGTVLCGSIGLEKEVPEAGRERDVLNRRTGTGLHIAVAFAHHQTFKVEKAEKSARSTSPSLWYTVLPDE